MELLHISRNELVEDLDRQTQALLSGAYPDLRAAGKDRYGAYETPTFRLLLWDRPIAIGHLAVFMREVKVGNEDLTIGMIGDVAIAPEHRGNGHTRLLVRQAHQYLQQESVPFSVLFAYEPRVYESSGYRLMKNETRFLDPDGIWKQLVYRGSMYAELSDRRWPNQMLDLRGRTV